MRWEYFVIHILHEEIESRKNTLNTLGNDGWELVVVTKNGIAYFKRPYEDTSNSRKEIDIILADLSKRNDPTSQKAAAFIRNTIGIANTIDNIGWHFEKGSDLIGNILHPQFWSQK